ARPTITPCGQPAWGIDGFSREFPSSTNRRFELANALVCADIKVDFLCGGRILARICITFRAASRVRVGTATTGAWVSYRPRDFVCAGFPARGFASERAVSLSGKPKSGISLSTKLVHGGQAGPGRSRQR